MLKRLVFGLAKGLVIGAVVALVLVKGLGVVTFGAALAYVSAIATGVLTGLVAGKPVWARAARIEAALKAIVGAALAAGVMFALRRWAGFSVDLSAIQGGAGLVGDLPAVSLPLVATVLAILFDLDNTPGETEQQGAKTPAASRARVADDKSPQGEAEEPGALEDEDAFSSEQQRRRH